MRTDLWTLPVPALLRELDTGVAGLSSAQATQRAPTPVGVRRGGVPVWWPMLARQFRSPMVLILSVATAITL